MSERATILCIDDEPPVLSAIRRLLRNEPYDILTTDDPRRVLQILGERKVHLVIADQRMPSVSGTDLLKQVRSASPDTIAIILTGHADLSDIAGAMNDGAVDRLIRKPWDDDGFRATIRELLERKRHPQAEGPVPAPPPAESVAKRLDCAGRPPKDLLDELDGFLGTSPPRAVIILEHLPQLQASLTDFLLEMVRRIVKSGTRAALVDGSGTAGTFLELVGGRVPLVVYETTSQITPPKRVLVVEDQEETLEYLSGLIESAGHECEAVGSVGDAIQSLTARRFDLVLLDLVLPDADGVEVARHILEKDLRIPVVAVSGFLDQWGGPSCAEVGIRRQVSKPYRAKEILDAIRDS